MQATPRKLVTLPEDVLKAIFQQLSLQQQATLRLVCKPLSAAVRLNAIEASTAQCLTRQAAVVLDSRFPQLRSLTCKDPVSTHHLSSLTRLTKICFATHRRNGQRHPLQLDLGPLEALPGLHTLQLESVSMQTLTSAPHCALAALTQLQELVLIDCTAHTQSGRRDSSPQDLSALPQISSLQVLSADYNHQALYVERLHKVSLPLWVPYLPCDGQSRWSCNC